MLPSIALALALGTTGGLFGPHPHHPLKPGGRILAPGPGYGWGFRNGNPDGYGYFDVGDALPLGADRVPEYFFPRFLAMPPEQMFLPTYYNPYTTRGQRYIPYAGGGGKHPMGGPPQGDATTPVHPYTQDPAATAADPPKFTGRAEAPPVASDGTGLNP